MLFPTAPARWSHLARKPACKVGEWNLARAIRFPEKQSLWSKIASLAGAR